MFPLTPTNFKAPKLESSARLTVVVAFGIALPKTTVFLLSEAVITLSYTQR